MKIFDKFLKVLKTDRNTFLTYILTLITAYIIVDRVVELLLLCFTGMSISYWGPIKYTLALACPVFAFFFSYSSKFIKSDEIKLSFFYSYCVSVYIIGISMVVQWLNHLSWILLLSLPNYKEIVLEFSHLIIPAFTAISIYIPATTFYKLVLWLYKLINNPIFPNTFKESILDYPGIDISGSQGTTGPYSFEVSFCNDKTTGKPVKIIEKRRFDTTLVIGPSGTGKTAMVFEPMIAQDLDKKRFFREVSKEMGYTALKTGIATLNCPYDNKYLNLNFKLDMLTPVEGKEKLYKAYMEKMIYATMPNGKIIYRNLGLTSVTPDFEHTTRLVEVAKNLNIPINVIDPMDPNSLGLNPFIIKNPALCGLIISMVIKALYGASNLTAELAYMEDLALQAIQNLCILLQVMYSRLNDGLMPSLEDLQNCFNDFDYVENMCEEMKKDEELSKEYALQLSYFEQNFYKSSDGRENMKRYIHFANSQLDVLLRAASVRNIICNRYRNINFADILENGDVTLLCTRASDIGGTAHKGFGRFFLFLMMCATEGRPGNENTRIPHFLYVDEFNAYSFPGLSDMFTIYRKFKVGSVLSSPTLSAIDNVGSQYMQVLLSNSPTKISFGNNTPEDYDWWEKEFGERREWVVQNNYDPSKSDYYSTNMGSVNWDWKTHMRKAKIQGLKFKAIIYKTKDKKGKNVVNFGTVDFLSTKYKEPQKLKTYNFDKYNHAISSSTTKTTKTKFNPKDIDFDSTDTNPIQTDTTDSSYFFDNEDAVSFNLNNRKDDKKN